MLLRTFATHFVTTYFCYALCYYVTNGVLTRRSHVTNFAESTIKSIKDAKIWVSQKDEVVYNKFYSYFKTNLSAWPDYKATAKYFLKHSDEWVKKLESI